MSNYLIKAKQYVLTLLAMFALVPLATSASQIPNMQLGTIGSEFQLPVQIAEMRITYRFDQMDAGKSHNAVPVQMTYRLHNPGNAQSFDLAIPLTGDQDMIPEITAIFVNGIEQPVPVAVKQPYFNTTEPLTSVVLKINMAPGTDQIIDIRALQPLFNENLVFAFRTGKAWSDSVLSGSLEAIFPFTAANWNVNLRKLNTEQNLIPLTYSDHSATWNFNDLDLKNIEDVFWQIANIDAITYFEQGHDKWQQNNNDPEAYAMLHRALLDMIPCDGNAMPLPSWWDNMYETITMGLIATEVPVGQEQWMKAMERWSANWSVSKENNECIEKQWRPERYAQSVKQIMALPVDQRSAAMQQTLENHFKFLRKLVAYKGENSLQDDLNNIPAIDPFNVPGLSDSDRQLLSKWDSRFVATTPENTVTDNQAIAPTTENKPGITQTVSSTLNNILSKLPRLSFGTQIILLGLLALIVLIIIGFIIFKWQENPKVPERPVEFKPKPPTVPLMGTGLAPKPEIPPVKNIEHTSTQTAVKPAIPWEPKKTENTNAKQVPWMPTANTNNQKIEKEQSSEQKEQKNSSDEKPTFRI